MKFVDEARMKVQAGNGGRGSTSFRREKFVPFGGPDGGDGGNGGSVFLRAAPGINTLADFRIERTWRAQHGEPGGSNDCSGRGGDDLYIPVPVGTTVRDAETGEQLGDLTREGDVLPVARGGKGGWGNQRFKSSTNRSPRQFGPGLPVPVLSGKGAPITDDEVGGFLHETAEPPNAETGLKIEAGTRVHAGMSEVSV